MELDGTTLTGTSASGDFGTITATGVQSLSLDETVDNTLTGPSTAQTWSIDGTQAGSVDGLAFTGVDTVAAGDGSDTLKSASTISAGTTLGVAFSGFAATTAQVTMADFRLPGAGRQQRDHALGRLRRARHHRRRQRH